MDEKKMKELSIIGVTVKIKTSLGEEVQGEILSVDTVTNCIVLREDTGDQNASNNTPSNCSSFRILKINFVKEIQCLGFPSSPPDLTLKSVDLNRLRSHEEQVLRVARAEAAKIGVGVTAEAQEIFNALSKTLPCSWDRDTIVVFEDIRISAPYSVDHCVAGFSATPGELTLVRKSVGGRKKQIAKEIGKLEVKKMM